jgi:hypothetical protein
VVTGVQDDETHPLPHALDHPRHDLVGHPVVRGVAPPQQHVGHGEHLGRETVRRFAERRGLHAAQGGERGGDRRVEAVRVDPRRLAALLLVDVLVPDRDVHAVRLTA